MDGSETTVKTSKSLPEVVNATPMMQQYLSIKSEYPDALLFYRMGDFYELFFDDAVAAAAVLDIALTKRGKQEGQDIPMCGVPHHSYEPYLNKLIKAGHRVAVCEQMERPEEAKKRGYKAVVKREVVRLITPGTIIEEALLDTRESNYLAALAQVNQQISLAWVDVSTGEFWVKETSLDSLELDITSFSPKELILSDTLFASEAIQKIYVDYRNILMPQVNNIFDTMRAERQIKAFYRIETADGFGFKSKADGVACGALLEYISLTHKGAVPKLGFPKRYDPQHYMSIDAATRRNLELFQSLSGERKGSLLSTIDRTVTGAGARLLRRYLTSPLMDVTAINQRLDNVQCLIDASALHQQLCDILSSVPDIERALSRLHLSRDMGKSSPRDLTAIRDGLQAACLIRELLHYSGVALSSGLQSMMGRLGRHEPLVDMLQQALLPEVGVLARDGGYIKQRYYPPLDEQRQLRDHGKEQINKMREQYRQLTGIPTLKINHNNVLGWFVEVTPSHSDKVTDEMFIHRQTLASAVRYTTTELKELESNIANAREMSLQMEQNLFEELRQKVCEQSEAISMAAFAIAELDVSACFATIVDQYGYTRPIISDDSVFLVENGRHPVVEVLLKKSNAQSQFTGNNCLLQPDERLWLITGPNMAGKSTFLRQNALIAIMAQMGCFVPADKAEIGAVDKVFSRVGASDDLASGRSTFMVEMVETATILNQATSKSFVILDEIGRGTATFDGMSIAWSVTEYLHNKCCSRTLFATHYHELTRLNESLEALGCYSMKVKEWKDDIVFLHQVVKGSVDRSYGVYVAKLAGLPEPVIRRAKEILVTLESSDHTQMVQGMAESLPLFSSEKPSENDRIEHSEVEEQLSNLDIDNLSPKEALDHLYSLKSKL